MTLDEQIAALELASEATVMGFVEAADDPESRKRLSDLFREQCVELEQLRAQRASRSSTPLDVV